MSNTQRYRKKPVEIEAMKFAGETRDAHRVMTWMEENLYPFLVGDATAPETLRYPDQVATDDSTPDRGIYIDPATGELMIRTMMEGDMRVRLGDWIICGVQGEFYPCNPDIFEATYEEVI